MLKTNKNVPNGKNHSSGKFLELQAYSKDSSHKLSNAKTIIGKDISIQGDIRGKEHMIIDGSVKGNIEMGTHNFALGPDNIKTPGKIEITEQASFQGDILAKSIAVENGAFFKGSVELITEPPQKTFSTEESTDKKADV
jgi:cytoskeletal protein CcmA (bactofilin family)